MAPLQKGDEDPQASRTESILLAPQLRVRVTLLDLVLGKLPGVTVARNGLCLATASSGSLACVFTPSCFSCKASRKGFLGLCVCLGWGAGTVLLLQDGPDPDQLPLPQSIPSSYFPSGCCGAQDPGGPGMVVLPRMLSGSLQSGGLPTGHLGAFFTLFVEFQEAQMIVENLNAPLADVAGETLWPAGAAAPNVCSASEPMWPASSRPALLPTLGFAKPKN